MNIVSPYDNLVCELRKPVFISQLKVVFHLARLFGCLTSRIKFRLNQAFEEVTYKLKAFFGVLSGENETVDSTRVFYVLSAIFLIALVFLSPDKVLQGLVPSEVSEKAQDIWKLIRRLIPS